MEPYLQAIVHGMPDPVASLDVDGRIACWNQSAQSLFLVGEAEALGQALDDVLGCDVHLEDGAQLHVVQRGGARITVRLALTFDERSGHTLVVFEQRAKVDPRDDLSPRLLETLQGLLAGHSEKQLAADMGLSPHTIHDYVKALYRRFGVASRAELLARVLSTGRNA